MRWYVNRNGETVGPLEDAEVVKLINGGAVEGSIRDEAGGNWMPLAQSPFAGLLPRPKPRSSPVAFGVALLLLSVAITWLVGIELGLAFFLIFGVVGAAVFSLRK